MSRERWNERHRERSSKSPLPPNVHLEKLVAHLEAGTALDLAAGDGRNALFLSRKGWKVTAVDFSEVGIEWGRAFAEDEGLSVDWLIRDLNEYVPPCKSFDLVCLFYLHVPGDQLAGVLKKAAAAVKPGGSLLIVGHDRTNITQGAGGPQIPDILYTPEEISALLPGMSVGYANRESCPADHGGLPPGTVQIDCVVRATCPL
ncbi:class I SAM-dependent methyltransferase [Marispirochaeta aestuarii]|uniref:class I SAM-dependent methyltransferase n=1 Tax=Marispirochaeta aestuarii TaxID=1963862 RepID=UPI001301CA6D|nr:class I SAM-dependent methyltransferase [Marispirochaeta aestuarii]